MWPSSELQLAAGAVRGRAHEHAGRPAQDAHAVAQEGQFTVAVLCDGCGAGAHSEVGARLGAGLLCAALLRRLRGGAALDEALLAALREEVLCALRPLVDALASEPGRRTQVVHDHFLFTIVGAAVTAKEAALFHLGDGLLCLNGEALPLGPYAGNAPPYLGYALIDEEEVDGALGRAPIALARRLPAAELRSALLGSDGVEELCGPGGAARLAEFWREDRYFQNRDALRRRLAIAQRREGLLADDATLIALRRPPCTST